MGKTAWTKSCHSSQRFKYTLKAHTRMPPMKSTWNSNVCVYAKTTDYFKKTLTLFVVDSIKLHLTAYKLFSIDIFRVIHLLNNWGSMTFITLLLQNINFHQYDTQYNTIKQKNVSTKMIVT